MSLVKLAHNICISQFCLCDYWQTTSPLPCVIGTALHLVVTFLLREMPLSELIAGLPVQSFYVTLLLFHCTPSFSAEDMCRGTTSSHGNLCVKQQYKEKELQFSRACTSAQITHSMPPPLLFSDHNEHSERHGWCYRITPGSCYSFPWPPSGLPRTFQARSQLWYRLEESIWEWQKGSNELPQSAHQLSKTDFCQPPDRFIPMQHTWIQHRADCCPATNKAFQAWGSGLGLLWSQPQPEGTVDTTKHEQCWGSPSVLCFTAASTYFNKGLTCAEDIFHAHLFFCARFLCNLKPVD